MVSAVIRKTGFIEIEHDRTAEFLPPPSARWSKYPGSLITDENNFQILILQTWKIKIPATGAPHGHDFGHKCASPEGGHRLIMLFHNKKKYR